MTFINKDKTRLNNRLYSVTGAFCRALMIPCFNQQLGWRIINYLPEPKTFRVFVAGVIRDFINQHLVDTIQIPIDTSPKLTASQQPAVSSFEAYQTPAR